MRMSGWSVALLALTACHRADVKAVERDASPSLASQPGIEPVKFSRPIAAARGAGGSLLVAGLVVPRGTITVTELADGGATRWTVDVLSEVAWSANAELRAFPTPDGAVIVFRGLRRGRTVTEAVTVDSKGRLVGAPFAAGSAACATETALAWIDGSKGGQVRVNTVDQGQSTSVTALTIPAEREPTLICGSHRLFALGEGDQDLTLAVGAPSTAPPRVVLRDHDFTDEEREHDTFVLEDTLGIVRVGKSGALAVREVSADDRGSWRRLTTRLADTDDVVAVDADADALTVVFTREDGDTCDGPGAPLVRGLRASRRGIEEQTFDLSPGECERDVGPFWTGAPEASFVVAWVERSKTRDPSAPRIIGLAYRAFTRSGLGELKRVPRPADEIVDAGCDRQRCYAVALVRAPGTDDMQPELVQSIAYP